MDQRWGGSEGRVADGTAVTPNAEECTSISEKGHLFPAGTQLDQKNQAAGDKYGKGDQ